MFHTKLMSTFCTLLSKKLMVFLFNLVWSTTKGKLAGRNPWKATTLEWQTPDVPPGHGNWGEAQPVVYRWAYAYGVPGVGEDFVPQNIPPDQVISAGEGREGIPDGAVQPAE